MKTWLITGCSSGFGRVLADAVAVRGDRVVATARDVSALGNLESRCSATVRAVTLDVTRPGDASRAVAAACTEFGGLDVLVNNAGVGFIGAIEEGTPAEYRPLFEINVFGLIETTRAALPALRQRAATSRAGQIVNLSSGAGIVGNAGSGLYCASKFAVEGLSEALAAEVAPLGIAVIIVEPGPFRTDFLGRSISIAADEIEDYLDTAGKRRRYREFNDGRQAGDPAKATSLILKAVDSSAPPLHLPLGQTVYDALDRKCAAFRRDMEAWKADALATDFT